MNLKYLIVQGLTIREGNVQLEQTALPERLFLAGYATIPNLQIEDSLSVALRFCIKSKRMITSPLFALLLESVHTQRHCESCCDSSERKEVEMRCRETL
jgi:hypothetical protein